MRSSVVAAFTILWLGVIFAGVEIGLRSGYPFQWIELRPYYMLRTNDSWAHNGFEIQKLLSGDPEVSQQFVFLGGSQALEAITTDAEMEGRLNEQGLDSAGFTSLVSSYKTFADEAKIVNAFSDAENFTFLLPIEAWRFKNEPSIQLEYTDTSDRFVPKYYFLPIPKEIEGDLGEGLDAVPFLRRVSLTVNAVPRVGELVKKRVLIYPQYRRWYTYKHDRHMVSKNASPWGEEDIVRFNERIVDNTSYSRNVDFNVQLVRDVIELAHKHGHRIILVDVPVNERTRGALETYGQGYSTMIRDLVAETGAGYIDLSKGGDWKNEHFRDHHHMLDSGREIFTLELAEALAHDMTSGNPDSEAQ